MLYILNSAVLTSFGCFDYQPMNPEEVSYLLRKEKFFSTIGYEETALALSELTGISIPVNRKTIKMETGDRAVVFRLVFPSGSQRIDPKDKGSLGKHLLAGNFELGLLTKK